jgi:hypothetical protein
MPKTTKPTGGAKRYPLNMRTTRETRERLEAAAAASGRSLAQEVEFRLEQSFRLDQADAAEEAMRKLTAALTEMAHKYAAGEFPTLGPSMPGYLEAQAAARNEPIQPPEDEDQ